ncbi:lipid A biosynthesis acyltransferase [Rickettsiella grylli]|uniref:LpxL/LpxP family Kdo(2)-lipid IV(A) lauroyl/palmitoleoyl acyltransferase n=1 Tax=Rickettsiella grylli TaxID=59196 RepID=UPI0008FD34D7|nr:LpxL/LpxP family Kdo(2)-lipid IV(A) lauroyl/palmitoleoyl acyltransferase [Rickettsiella grylli]OJA00697.1 lipid A biosynthesis acyltransferase [Rickettsiella grylli]
MQNKFLGHLHPRYWSTWLGLGLLYLFTKLPYSFQLKLGKHLGHIAYYGLKRFRHIGKTNLKLCFPHLSHKEQTHLLKKQFQSLGMGIVESAMAWWMPDHRLHSLIHVQGLEHLQTAMARKKGVLILSGHFTSLDICGRLFSNIFPMHVVYREQKNQIIDRLLKQHRQFKWMQPIHRHAIRQIIKTLKQNKAIWYAADQDYGPRHSLFPPFFNIPAATISTPSRYARRTGASVVTLFYYRLPNGNGYQIIIGPILENFGCNDYNDTLCFNRLLEDAIRAHPEQYLWIHRRFKTRPQHEPYPY